MANSYLLEISVEDVNQNSISDFEVIVIDVSSATESKLSGNLLPRDANKPVRAVFDLGIETELTIELKARNFFDYKVTLRRDIVKNTFEVDARSPKLSLSLEIDFTIIQLRLIARRVRKAHRTAPTPPVKDIAPPIVDKPDGIVADSNNNIKYLFNAKVNNFPAVLGREIIGDPDVDNWERFLATTSDVDPSQHDGGTWFEWLEYGDPNGFFMLVAIWAVKRAGARPDGKVDLHFFFCPRTDYIDLKLGRVYAPPELYPYGRKRIGQIIAQPYSLLAYSYLSTGGSPGSGFGIAYQSIASRKSHVVIMPLNAFGYAGPLLCRQGLNRLAQEVAVYVSDNTRNTPAASSKLWESGIRQSVNRIAISGFSAGAFDTLKLFHCTTIAELASSYGSAKGDPLAQEFARRLSSLNSSLWQSPIGDFDRKWSEYYCVDGYFGSDDYRVFPGELALWFAGDSERILRVYATSQTMKSSSDVLANKLASIFRGVVPNQMHRNGDYSFKADEWHRPDGRATLAWFSESYMRFNAVPNMPTNDAHHTVPRVVFSHALAQSRLLQF